MWYLSWRAQAAKIHNIAAFKYWRVSVERANNMTNDGLWRKAFEEKWDLS